MTSALIWLLCVLADVTRLVYVQSEAGAPSVLFSVEDRWHYSTVRGTFKVEQGGFRYYRLQLSSAAASVFSVSDWSLYALSSTGDAGSKITVSASTASSGTSALAVDSSTLTSWTSVSGLTAYIQVDLGVPVHVSHVVSGNVVPS